MILNTSKNLIIDCSVILQAFDSGYKASDEIKINESEESGINEGETITVKADTLPADNTSSLASRNFLDDRKLYSYLFESDNFKEFIKEEVELTIIITPTLLMEIDKKTWDRNGTNDLKKAAHSAKNWIVSRRLKHGQKFSENIQEKISIGESEINFNLRYLPSYILPHEIGRNLSDEIQDDYYTATALKLMSCNPEKDIAIITHDGLNLIRSEEEGVRVVYLDYNIVNK